MTPVAGPRPDPDRDGDAADDAGDLAIVIPTRGRFDILARTLDALAAQRPAGFEVIVVVDGEDQDVPATVEQRDTVRVLVQEHSGPGVARNRGVAATDRRLVLFLGDDMIPRPGLVANHLARHARHPDDTVAVLGHVQWHPDVADNRILRWLDWSQTQFDYATLADQAGQDVGWSRFYTANVSLKRSLFERAGGFDPDFMFLYEDIDLGHRLRETGMTLVYEPDAGVHHLHEYTLDALRRRFETTALSERIMVDKHPWFTPYFHDRMDAAASRSPARRVWTRLADVLPGALGRHARREANAWYHQQFADAFLTMWDRAVDVVELRRYLGDDFEARLIAHHDDAVREEAQHLGDEDAFYRTSTSYLYDLTVFAMSGTKDPYREELARRVPDGARLLDYGCGIGSDGLALVERGYDVHFADFDNPSTRYLRWRLEQRGLDAPVYDVERDGIPAGFDAAYAFDVIEHVDDPVGFLERLEALADLVVVNLLEDDPHDHENLLHRSLPIAALVDRARDRGLVSHTVHHDERSHLLVYRGARAPDAPAARAHTPAGNDERR